MYSIIKEKKKKVTCFLVGEREVEGLFFLFLPLGEKEGVSLFIFFNGQVAFMDFFVVSLLVLQNRYFCCLVTMYLFLKRLLLKWNENLSKKNKSYWNTKNNKKHVRQDTWAHISTYSLEDMSFLQCQNLIS